MACNHDCSNCGENCSERVNKEDMLLAQNAKSNIKKIIGVVSGKGGVGKSLVSSLLACSLSRRGLSVGILDADITGPSIPHAFGIKEKANGDGTYIYPATTENLGIDIISSNMLLENDDDPILWRGSLISSLVSQFYKDVRWEEKDVLLIDMPPGTGDVALTTFQSIPLDALIIVTSPQDLVSMIVKKALKMAEMMDIKVLGIIENMAYVKCPDCDKKIYIYGENKNDEIYKSFSLDKLASLPIDPVLAKCVDNGLIEEYYFDDLNEAVDRIIDLEAKEKKRDEL